MNKKHIEGMIKKVALGLGELNSQAVFVGGAVVSLYADDPAAGEESRPTKDIDIFLEITTYVKLTILEEELRKKRFFPASEEAVMCRFKYQDILVDIMTTKEVGWAPADKWFLPGLKNIQQYKIDEVTINILHISYFLATKFNAFLERDEDARYSRHFEDIVFILDNRLNLVHEIISSPEDVKEFLLQLFQDLLTEKYEEAILGHLPYDSQTERYDMLKSKLIEIVSSIK